MLLLDSTGKMSGTCTHQPTHARAPHLRVNMRSAGVWRGVVVCGVVACGVVECGVVECGVVECGVVVCGAVVRAW